MTCLAKATKSPLPFTGKQSLGTCFIIFITIIFIITWIPCNIAPLWVLVRGELLSPKAVVEVGGALWDGGCPK